MLLALTDASISLHARAAVEECALRGGRVADLPLRRPETVRALYGTGGRDWESAEKFASIDARKPELGKRMSFIQLENCGRFNALSNEGAHIVLENIDDRACITAEAAIDGTSRDQILASLQRIERGANDKQALVVLCLRCGNEGVSWLSDHCRELIVVNKCEPGPRASSAFSMTAMSLESRHAEGLGRTMCEVKYRDNRLTRDFSPLIAPTAVDRCMWYLAREGEAFADIAEWLGIDKGTVSRHLRAPMMLPTDICGAYFDPPEGWREEWFPFLGIESDEQSDDECDEQSDDEYDVGATSGVDQRRGRPL
jgi:hypothetical protein